MLWWGASWVKRLRFWLNLGVEVSWRWAPREGLVFFLEQKVPIYLILLCNKIYHKEPTKTEISVLKKGVLNFTVNLKRKLFEEALFFSH